MSAETLRRLQEMRAIISEPTFGANQDWGSTVGYYIFDYPPADELVVRQFVADLLQENREPPLVCFDLFAMVFAILQERGYLEQTFQFEQERGTAYAIEAVSKLLRQNSRDNLLVRRIMENTPAEGIVLLTGVGKVFPLVRSHTVLNHLHQVLERVPVIMFFPGRYNGRSLALFGEINDDNYYRALKIVSGNEGNQ